MVPDDMEIQSCLRFVGHVDSVVKIFPVSQDPCSSFFHLQDLG